MKVRVRFTEDEVRDFALGVRFTCSAHNDEVLMLSGGRWVCPECDWADLLGRGRCIALTTQGKRCRIARGIDLDFLLCEKHLREARWKEDYAAELQAERDAHRERELRRSKVVYYVRQGDYIKIGYATNLRARLSAIGENRTSRPKDLPTGPVELLATHQGGPDAEWDAHRRFQHLRVNGEWFRAASDLLAHIDKVRARAERRAAS